MKKVSVGGRWSLAVVLSGWCALSAICPAHAQDEEWYDEAEGPGAWVLTKIEGTFESLSKSKSTGGSFSGSPQTETFVSTHSDGGTMGLHKRTYAVIPAGSSPGGEAVASSKGTNFKVWLEWQGGGVPTKTCYLRVVPFASAQASASTSTEANWTLTVDNSVNHDGDWDSGVYYPNDPHKAQAKNTGSNPTIIAISTGSQRSVAGKDINVSPSAEANISESRYKHNDTGDVSAESSVNALPLDYSLSLSRSGAPGAKIKGKPGVVIDESKDEWIDENGEGHGHTTYSHNYWAIYLDVPVKRSHHNWQNFGVELGSNWSPNAVATWSPSDPDDTTTGHKQEIIFGSIEKGVLHWSGNATGEGRANASLTMTETVGGTTITETAKYKLMLHDEWEEVSTVLHPNVVLKNPQQIGGGSHNNTDTTGNYTFGVTETKSLAIKGGFSTELGRKVADVLKVVPKFSLDVTYTDTTATTNTFSATLKPGEMTWLEVVETYQRYHVKGSEYNSNGYVGENNFDVDIPCAPTYTYQIHEPPVQVGGVDPDQ